MTSTVQKADEIRLVEEFGLPVDGAGSSPGNGFKHVIGFQQGSVVVGSQVTLEELAQETHNQVMRAKVGQS